MTGYVRQRSPGSWEISYELAADPLTGHRRRASATVRGTRKDAERELRRLLVAVDTGAHVDPTRITVRGWVVIWLAAVRQEVAPRTHERYKEIMENFVLPKLGDLTLTKLAAIHIKQLYAGLAEGGRRDKKPGGLSPQTRQHIHRVLRAALARAVEEEPPLLARNPADVFKKRLPKVERHEMTTLTAEQSQFLLAAIAHTRVYWPAFIGLASGTRRGEILALQWKNVDLDRASLRVVASLEETKKGLRFKPPKNDASRRQISLSAFAVDELRRLKRQQAEELLLLGIRQTPDTLLCARADGEVLRPRSLTHEFTRLVAGLTGELPRVRFHDLRHSHATQLLIAGVHPKVVQERLGHATIAITLDLYSHVIPTLQEDAAARLEALVAAARAAMPTFGDGFGGPAERRRRQIRRQRSNSALLLRNK
jgi:integrase